MHPVEIPEVSGREEMLFAIVRVDDHYVLRADRNAQCWSEIVDVVLQENGMSFLLQDACSRGGGRILIYPERELICVASGNSTLGSPPRSLLKLLLEPYAKARGDWGLSIQVSDHDVLPDVQKNFDEEN